MLNGYKGEKMNLRENILSAEGWLINLMGKIEENKNNLPERRYWEGRTAECLVWLKQLRKWEKENGMQNK
jgi:hypothetical protein